MLNSKYTQQDLVIAEEQQQLVASSSSSVNLFSSNQKNHELTFTQQHDANNLLSDEDDDDDDDHNNDNKVKEIKDFSEDIQSEENRNIDSMTISETALTAGDAYTRIKMPFKSKITQNVMQTTIATLGLILFYFALSIGLTFYQRWLLNKYQYPLTVVLYHLIIKLILAGLVRLLYRLFTGKSRVHIDWKTSLEKISPSGLASGLDIGFSNWGLALVTISLYTMTKSTTVIFILIFAIILGLEKKSWSLAMIVIMISGGLLMFTYKSTQFNALGFIFLLFASLTSGIRWSFAQLVMQKSNLGLHNPIDMVYHMQPWMILAILPFTLGFEGQKIIELFQSLHDQTKEDIIIVWSEATVGAVIAFIMELSEFLVLAFTSSLTLSIAGIFKEICQLVLAVEINGDQLSFMNIMGLVMCLGGICSHVIHKYSIVIRNRNRNNVNNGGSGGGGGGGGNGLFSEPKVPAHHQLKTNYRSSQKVPLLLSDANLDDSDNSDDSQNDNQSASEVIFDVLKRRDTRK